MNITLDDEKIFKNRIINFTEWNPHPIIEMNFDGTITYLNLASRTQFPTILKLGERHPVLVGVRSQISDITDTQQEMVIYVREVAFSNKYYDQQAFSLPGKHYIYIFMTDITERKNAENEIKQFNDELEQRVSERTEQLNQRTHQLRLAKETAEYLAAKAEAANRAKTTFLTTMSHEFKTPLNGIIGMTSLLLDSDLSKEQHEFTKAICNSGEILLRTINNILEYSQIESETFNLSLTEFKLDSLITELMNDLSQQNNEKNLDINFKIDDNVPLHLLGDAERIKQILKNLLENAIKFTEIGNVDLHVKLAEKSADTAILILEVIDTGIGISEPMRKKLFQPFVQGDDSMTRKYGGSGLGLAICKRLTEAMEGKLSLESKVEKGSKFTLLLPLKIQSSNSKKTDNRKNK